MHYVISHFCGDFQQFRSFPSSLFDFPFVRLSVPDDVCVCVFVGGGYLTFSCNFTNYFTFVDFHIHRRPKR